METTVEKIDVKRAEVLARVHAFLSSKPNAKEHPEFKQLESELASLHTTLQVNYLTQPLLTTGALFVGYLISSLNGYYVKYNAKNNHLFAVEASISGAIRFSLKSDAIGNVEFTASLAGKKIEYLSWRSDSPHQCALKNEYKKTTIKEWVNFSFMIFNGNDNDDNRIGLQNASEGDNQLRNRSEKNTDYQYFSFRFYDEESFTDDDRLIFNAFLKTNSY